MRLEVRSDSPALLVLAENWFPAWKAEIDGVEVPILRANHSLRAVPVEAGLSEVVVFFDGGTFTGPLLLSLVSLFLALGVIFVRPRGGKGTTETAP